MENRNNKGFTLAELLIVVAIIAVLTAIAIPVFSSQLEKAKEATDLANLRAAYAEAANEALLKDATATRTVTMTQSSAGFVTEDAKIGSVVVSTIAAVSGATKGRTVTITVTKEGALSFSSET